jgi:tetratricopeptide (TPR) repeat protein
MLSHQGRFGEAIEEWQRVVSLRPDSARAHSNLAIAYFGLGRHEDAAHECERALAVQPTARGYSNLGTALFYLRRFDDCAAAFENAVALQPEEALAWGHLGSACRLIPGREERAREALDRAVTLMRDRLERNPNDASGWSRLAEWLINLNQPQEAQVAIERALRLAPGHIDTVVAAVGVFQQLDPGRAIEALRRALSLGYHPDRFVRDPALAPLRESPEFWSAIGQPPP